MQEEEESVAKLTDNASTLEEEVAKTKVQNTIQIDPELEAFEKLKVREVRTEGHDTAAAFLAQFHSTAASLQPDERIKLVVYTHESMKSLKTVLSDPQANKICSLHWTYSGKEDVNLVIPLLIDSCSELASLEVYFKQHSAFDFVSSLLEHPSNKIKVLDMPKYTKGDIPRFFAALGQSQVSALTLSSVDPPEFAQSLHEYLARDLLVKLEVWMNEEQVTSEMMMSLAQCTRLAKLEMLQCTFSQPTAFTHIPKSITKLVLHDCTFVGDFNWSFLADSNVRELDFLNVRGVDGTQCGSALAVQLRAKGLDTLRFIYCDFTNETLAAAGVELGRIKILDIDDHLSDASIGLIALVLQSPNSEMKELVLDYSDETASIKNHLVPALKHPNCNLAELSLWTSQAEHREAAGKVEDTFCNLLALFALLQGKQVRRLYCPLRRLPVEMLRLVGAMLI
ncbi:hypothetical protein BASA81_010530 [Batrachochytrium salamandrivorans]|nr:hypothetical protein BASA81_010530 [Batrachochytrium salamandrivorans]